MRHFDDGMEEIHNQQCDARNEEAKVLRQVKYGNLFENNSKTWGEGK